MKRIISLCVVALIASACGGAATRESDWSTMPAKCGAAPDVPRRPFRSPLIRRLGAPRHAAPDVVVAVGETYEIRGKFTYGVVRKNLEGEPIALVVGEGDCGPWTVVGTADTDKRGRARFERPPIDHASVQPFHLIAGDGTRASANVWAVAPGKPAVLFDIDGTLTTGDAELLEELVGGAAEMQAGAADVATRWAELGYLVVYMTGRPTALRASTVRWLSYHGFPRGPLLTPNGWRDALPRRSSVGAFKRRSIEAVVEAGLVFEAAYGNAATDVCAYAESGIEPARTWIVGDPPPCDRYPPPNPLASYVDHLQSLADRAPVP